MKSLNFFVIIMSFLGIPQYLYSSDSRLNPLVVGAACAKITPAEKKRLALRSFLQQGLFQPNPNLFWNFNQNPNELLQEVYRLIKQSEFKGHFDIAKSELELYLVSMKICPFHNDQCCNCVGMMQKLDKPGRLNSKNVLDSVTPATKLYQGNPNKMDIYDAEVAYYFNRQRLT